MDNLHFSKIFTWAKKKKNKETEPHNHPEVSNSGKPCDLLLYLIMVRVFRGPLHQALILLRIYMLIQVVCGDDS